MNKEEFKVNWAKWEGAQVDEWFDKMEALEKENEQLRAQLAERDKEIERKHLVDHHLSIFKAHNEKVGVEYAALVHKYAKAQETIADFRSALEFYADKDCYVWHQYNLGTLIDHDKGKRAIEALATSAKGV